MGFKFGFAVVSVTVLICVRSQHTDLDELSRSGEATGEKATIDDVLATSGDDEGQNDSPFFFDAEDNVILTEYDIAMSPEEVSELLSQSFQEKRTAALKDKKMLWPGAIVDYEIKDENDFSEYDMDEVTNALADWAHYTCVQFRNSTTATNRVVIKPANRCFSYVGMRGGIQAFGLGIACRFRDIIIHEMGHALGLQHEQNRPDRDEYVRINYENIKQFREKNFKKKSSTEIGTFEIPYDYYSIMHYSKLAFTKNNLTTIETIDPQYADIIGNQKTVSFGDVKTVNLMYGCSGADEDGCALKDEDCPGTGFVGKDCRCWCQGKPVRYCSEKDREEKGSLIRVDCSDKREYCVSWAKKGWCESMPSYMSTKCKKTCNLCQLVEE